MQYIKAPYNFVPVSNKVVFPEWRNAVSHDIPFQDGESGTITVKIKAESPIFTRTGHTQDQKENVTDFSNHKEKYFIPGSSIRGSIRNLLEILTFSKMEKVDDTKYSVRDLSPGAKHIYLDNFKIGDISCGWLKKESESKYTLQDCGTPGRISQEQLGESFYKHFQRSNAYHEHRNPAGWNNKKDKYKSAKYKYDNFRHLAGNNTFDFRTDDNGRKLYEFGENERGTIVFTGQPDFNDCNPIIDRKTGQPIIDNKTGKPQKRCGKHFEFIFFDTTKTVEPVDDKVIKNFFFAYFDHDKNSQSEDWKWRKSQLDDKNNKEGIPVFFRRNEKGKIKDMGLSFLYKITYENSVKDLLSKEHKEYEPDFAETIFGYINKKTKQALKGRVHFGHAFNTNDAQVDILKTETLSDPKASYYPNYIWQDIDKTGKVIGNYQTFMDKKAQLSGWKRYPVHKGNGVKNNPGTENVATQFIPLRAGAEFELKIRLHNMRKVEIGAILSALTFHNTPNTFHGIGMAKPLGYGKSKFEITDISGFEELTKQNQTDYLKAFEAYMRANVDWEKQIKELIAMSSEQNNSDNSELAYMKMDPKGINEFVKAKTKEEALQMYSKLNGMQFNSDFRLLASKEDIVKYGKRQKEEKNIFKKPNIEQFYDTKIYLSKTAFLEKCRNTNLKLEYKIKTKLQDLKSKHKEIDSELKKREAKSMGLSKLLPKVNEYNTGKDIIKKYQDKVGEIPASEYPAIKNYLKRCYDNMGKKKQKGWSKFNKNPWKYIANTWVGKETAQTWYNEMIDNK